jgi:hypothetical protein
MTRAAYGEIVSALANARPDPATESFDAEVDVALDSESIQHADNINGLGANAARGHASTRTVDARFEGEEGRR